MVQEGPLRRRTPLGHATQGTCPSAAFLHSIPRHQTTSTRPVTLCPSRLGTPLPGLCLVGLRPPQVALVSNHRPASSPYILTLYHIPHTLQCRVRGHKYVVTVRGGKEAGLRYEVHDMGRTMGSCRGHKMTSRVLWGTWQ